MENESATSHKSPRLTWPQATIVVALAIAAGALLFVGRPLLLAPPLLESSAVAYWLAALIWLPIFAACLLLRPSGDRRRAVITIIASGVVAGLFCLIFPARPFPVGTLLEPKLECSQEALANQRVRYTCVADRMFGLTTYTLEGAAGSPFVTLISESFENY